ncbi:MAG TPA: isoprenyl transferase [Hungateiclostridium thermocellum]|uniref:Isoprenyl transferase n=2 Tax=Acetivibrio thermocellus TaxID=1515 RepID=A3DE54_ACET2|nr:isoprenyl transferase [Acetivibrio thermocellus]ABN52233.1 undecaprenyl diphosphate synthase [Acetivibrio thermocellus ATCC 27405]ADU74278.1 undecaprenyl diphosphate synthase [Acetivibrio thermocellus DSM 1313]ALX08220.1 Undecaprenyl pyrophosphate synthase [Acetivibrio thermocellus AD2]ANV75968.1 Undecaprenyl pyrophosphate synthase [Acetivibrio thermocellus DSM 2360]EIC05972.1 undecaprenyl diphosphate synthase [Acetivibrio thermocellus YS]
MGFWKNIFKAKKWKKGNIDYSKLPTHIAIIMDGNGRWAKKRALPRSMGHREGAKILKEITTFCGEIGIKYLTVYAFSTENWKRPKSEVDALMSLLLDYLKNAETHIGGKDVRIQVIGDTSVFDDEIKKEIDRVTKLTSKNNGLILNIALNYGSRAEIVHAAKRMAKEVLEGKLKPDDINEEVLNDRLYTAKIPDPDLLIRPGGEKRLSNFLLWQSAYTELWYTDVLWPDFKKEHIVEAILDYQRRNRRFGGI